MGDMADYLIDQGDDSYWDYGAGWEDDLRFSLSFRHHVGDSCPKGCGGTLVVRYNRTTGEPFLGCSSFPKCKGY